MNHLQVINAWVLDDRKTASYKWLSRQLSVHVNVAKQMLFEFVQTKSPGDVSVLYYVQGEHKDGSLSCMAVSDVQLKDVQAEFVRTSVHVLSVQPGPVPDIDALSKADLALTKQDSINIIKLCGAIQNSDIHTIEIKTNKKTNETKKACPASSVTTLVNTKSHSANLETVKPFSAKKSLETSKSAGKQPSSASSFFLSRGKPKASSCLDDGSVTAISSKKAPIDTNASLKLGSQKSTAKTAANTTKSSNSTVSRTRTQSPVRTLNTKSMQQSQQISNMFDNDDSCSQKSDNDEMQDCKQSMVNEDNPLASAIPSIEASVCKNLTVAILSDSDHDESLNNQILTDSIEKNSTSNKHSSFNQVEAGTEKKRRIRKTRKIRTTKRVMVGKYMKTVDVSDVESYSDEEIVVPRQSLTVLAKSENPIKESMTDHADEKVETDKFASTKSKLKGKAASSMTNQKSLLSFFGKKT
ncbi:DNA polymerase delta subunit 3 [Batrachochytrium dendrobatidis]|nr:DNA polymerase delta subunit 3 [Batrachochytrium dendrobatidis]